MNWSSTNKKFQDERHSNLRQNGALLFLNEANGGNPLDNDPYKTDFTYKTNSLNNGMNYGSQGNTAKYGFEVKSSDKPILELPPQSSQPSLKLTLNPDNFNSKITSSASTSLIKNEFFKKPSGGAYEGRGLVLPPANDTLQENKKSTNETNPRFFNNQNNILSSNNTDNTINQANQSSNSRDFSKLGLPASSKLDEFMAKKNEEQNLKNAEENSNSKMKSPMINNSKIKGLDKAEDHQPEDMKNYPQTTKVRTLRNMKGSEDSTSIQEESEYLKMKTVTGPSRPERRKSPGTGERKNPPPIVKPTTHLTKADILIASSDEEDDDDNAENQELFLCPEGCGRKFGKKGLKKHVKVCKKIFQSKRDAFDSSAARNTVETKAPTNNTRGKKETQSVDNKKKGGVALDIDMGNSKKKAKWKQDSDAFRAVVKVGKEDSKKEELPPSKPPAHNNTSKKPPRK